MVRPFGKFVLALGAVALLASPALAQQGKGRGGFGFGGMGGGGQILTAPNVQKDLKLSDEQVGKVQATLREIREKHADDYAAIREASQEDRPAKSRALNEQVTGEIKKAMGLSEEQSKRFDQISLQAQGLMAFLSPTVQEKVKLTDDQKEKIREIQQSSFQAFQGVNLKDASEEERAEFRKKMTATQKENMTKALAVLSDDQKKEWKALTGEPVEINIPPFRRPGA
jgi:hypothetical protein